MVRGETDHATEPVGAPTVYPVCAVTPDRSSMTRRPVRPRRSW